MRYKRFVLAQPKCSSITLSRKRQQFHAYVYKMGDHNLELIHSHSNGPQYCKHNARLNYPEANIDPCEGNGDSDLDNMDENGNKINTNTNFKSRYPKHPICTIQKTGKMAEKQRKSFIQLPPNLRILGIYFDPELYFNEHIRIVQRKAEIKLHGLLKLAFCKHFHFRPSVMLKLFESVIRPKIEYAMCTVSASTKFDELFKLQRKATKIALQAKKNTPTQMINEIGFIKSIGEKLKEQQIKLWHKCKRSPDNYLQRDTYEKWKKYIITNDKNCIDESGNIILDEGIFYHVANSPLSRCYKLMRSIYKPYQNILLEKEPCVMKSPPTNSILFPNNLHTINNDDEIEKITTTDKCFNFGPMDRVNQILDLVVQVIIQTILL